MISELLLNFPDSASLKTFVIEDASLYNENLPITCGQLCIKTPGFTHIHTYEPTANFKINVTLESLGLQVVNSFSTLGDLPDGNYQIRYSINPNNKLFVEYNYYNVKQLYAQYILQLCKYFNNKCDMTQKQQNIEMNRLFEISNLISYAKISAEECDDVNNADNLYNSAKSKINSTCNGTTTCK